MKKVVAKKKVKVAEKKTGEKYKSKAAMIKHEKSEPMFMKKKEGEMKCGGKKMMKGGKKKSC